MHNLFVYGSLKSGYWNNALLRFAEFVGNDETVSDDYDLRCWGSYPAVYKGGPTKVKGELYIVDDETFAQVDGLEGYPTFYNREEVELASGVTAWMYYIDEEDREGAHCATGEWRK